MPAEDTAAAVDAPQEGPDGSEDIGLEAIAPEGAASDAPDPWAEPPELDEALEQFDRPYVEGLRSQAADYRTRAKEYADAIGELPVEDVKTAAELLSNLQTEQGVISMFYQTGQALGLGAKEMEALFAAGSEDPADEIDPDDDEVLTKADLKAALKAQQEQLATASQEAQIEVARGAATNALATTFATLAIADEVEKSEIMIHGEKYLPANVDIPTAEQVETAVRKGYDDWNKANEARVQKYLTTKRAQRDQSPKTLGENAGAGAEEQNTEKRTLTQVIEARRARERANR